MANEYDAIVIGSGLGGLTAGALFAHVGHKVLVLEKNATFGGAATTYQRGALTIEASLHETTDPRTTVDPKGEIFAALDLYKDVEFVPVGDFYEVRCPLIGAPLTIPHGVEALGERLMRRFPGETDAITRFLKQIESIEQALAIFMEKHDGLWWLAHGAELPLRLWPVFRDIRASVSDVLQRYFGDNEALKFAVAANLAYYADDPDNMWWLFYAVAQGGFFHGGGYYLKGGSQTLSDQLVARIRAGGGEARAEHNVEEILLNERGAAIGVRFAPTSSNALETAHAPVVFANAAPHAISTMLPGEEGERFMAAYRDLPVSISLFSITLGLNKRPAELGMRAYSTMLIPLWMKRLSDFRRCADLLADMPYGRVPALGIVDRSSIDSGLDGGELYPVSVVGVDRLANWEGLGEQDYQARKAAWLNAVIAALDQEWAGLADAVVQQEFATARTMHEYLNTPGGALYGFAPNVPARSPLAAAPHTPKTTIPGLWLASSYAGAGGFTGAMSAGGTAAKQALHELL